MVRTLVQFHSTTSSIVSSSFSPTWIWNAQFPPLSTVSSLDKGRCCLRAWRGT